MNLARATWQMDRPMGGGTDASSGQAPGSIEEALGILAQLAEIGARIDVEPVTDVSSPLLEAPTPVLPLQAAWDEEQLRIAEARYRALIEQIPAVTFLASLSGGSNEIYVSPQIETLVGFTQEEWVSDPILWFRQTHPDDREWVSRQFAQSCLTGQPFRGVIRVFTKAGHVVWVHAEARFVQDQAGNLVFLQGVGFDVTEHFRAQAAREELIREQAARVEADRDRERLRGMFENLPAAITLVRARDSVIEFVNQAAMDTLGVGPEVVGRTLEEAFPELTPELGVLTGVAESGKPFTATEWRLVSPRWSGERFFNFVCQPLRDHHGNIEFVLNHAVEVTDQVLARREIEEALQVRDDFLSVAAHELRNPINSLRLGLQSIDRRAKKSAEPLPLDLVMSSLDRANGQVDRLARLVDSLLDVSRIRAGRLSLEPEPTDLAEVVRGVVERASGDIGQRPVTLDADGPVVGTWDRLRIEQVVTNLVSNAIKYGDEKAIEISVTRDAGAARLRVRDHGIGLSDEDQQRIFEKFERAAPMQRYGGLGLGLWITRQIIEAHGGRITVRSELGEGSEFTVEVPIDAPRAAE